MWEWVRENAPTKRGGSDGKGKGSNNRPKRHQRPIAAAARGAWEGRVYNLHICDEGSDRCLYTSSKVGECCRRWRLSSMSIEIFDMIFSASFAHRRGSGKRIHVAKQQLALETVVFRQEHFTTQLPDTGRDVATPQLATCCRPTPAQRPCVSNQISMESFMSAARSAPSTVLYLPQGPSYLNVMTISSYLPDSDREL